MWPLSLIALGLLWLAAVWLVIPRGVAGVMVVPAARQKLYVGLGGERGMTYAVLVHDDGRLINADHLSTGRASKMALHPKSVGPTSKAHKRETPQRGSWRTTHRTRGSVQHAVRQNAALPIPPQWI